MLAVGCGEHESTRAGVPTTTVTSMPTPMRTATPTATPPSSGAEAACAKLAGCAQCFINQTGQCMSNADCAQRLSADVAICINGVSGCDQSTLGDCLFPGCDGNDPTGDCQ